MPCTCGECEMRAPQPSARVDLDIKWGKVGVVRTQAPLARPNKHEAGTGEVTNRGAAPLTQTHARTRSEVMNGLRQ